MECIKIKSKQMKKRNFGNNILHHRAIQVVDGVLMTTKLVGTLEMSYYGIFVSVLKKL
jgi:hypothetical protein